MGSIWNNLGQGLAQDLYSGTGAIERGIGNLASGFFNGAQKVATPTTAPTASSIVAANPATQTINGKTFNAAGDPVTGIAQPIVNGGGTSATPNTAAIQSQLAADKTQLAALQAQQAAQTPNANQNSNGTYINDGGGSANNTGTATNGTLPNVNTTDPNSRSAQINALTQNLNTTGTQGSQGDPAEQALETQIQQEEQGIGNQTGAIIGNPEGMALQTGQNAALLAQQEPILNSLTNELTSYQANRGQNVTAETNALGGAENNVPATQVLNPAQSLVSPFGNTITSGGGGSTSSLISSLAQQVANGQISAADAQSQLPDQALSGELNQAIIGIDPSFSTTQSNANTAIQGALPPAAANATAQLQNLGTALQAMPASTQTTIPILNNLLQTISGATNAGGTAGSTQALSAARQDAIASVQNALETANGMSPTQAGDLANSYFPPGLTESQFQAGVQQFQAQITGKENAYGNPGTVSPTAGQNIISAGGYNYQLVNGQYVPVQ